MTYIYTSYIYIHHIYIYTSYIYIYIIYTHNIYIYTHTLYIYIVYIYNIHISYIDSKTHTYIYIYVDSKTTIISNQYYMSFRCIYIYTKNAVHADYVDISIPIFWIVSIYVEIDRSTCMFHNKRTSLKYWNVSYKYGTWTFTDIYGKFSQSFQCLQ